MAAGLEIGMKVWVGVCIREGQRVLPSATSAPCSAGAGINAGYHRVLDKPARGLPPLEYPLLIDAREYGMMDLHAFEDIGAVVKTRARRVEVERSIRSNLRWGPPEFRRKLHVEHMVCRDLRNLSPLRRWKGPNIGRTSPHQSVRFRQHFECCGARDC